MACRKRGNLARSAGERQIPAPAALAVTEQVLRDEHPLVGQCVGEPQREPGEAVVLSAARLIVGRCIELRELLNLYDAVLDRLRPHDDDEIPF
jgi:hypothetical protein